MIYHVLNGDALAQNFNLEGEIIICREALIEGNLAAQNIAELWHIRAHFARENYGKNDYLKTVKSEFDKLSSIKANDEVNLWFGSEAFCQVNMSFVLSIIPDKCSAIYRVFPDAKGWDCSFANLNKCFAGRQRLAPEEIAFAVKLWEGFQANNEVKLKDLSLLQMPNFPGSAKVCRSLIGMEMKTKRYLRKLTANGETDFAKIFSQFREKAGIYGFGDTQVKNILRKL